MALRGGFDSIAFFTTTFISLTTYTKTIATDLNGTFYMLKGVVNSYRRFYRAKYLPQPQISNLFINLADKNRSRFWII